MQKCQQTEYTIGGRAVESTEDRTSTEHLWISIRICELPHLLPPCGARCVLVPTNLVLAWLGMSPLVHTCADLVGYENPLMHTCADLVGHESRHHFGITLGLIYRRWAIAYSRVRDAYSSRRWLSLRCGILTLGCGMFTLGCGMRRHGIAYHSNDRSYVYMYIRIYVYRNRYLSK